MDQGPPTATGRAELGGPAALPSDHITTTTRDPQDLGRRLQAWLAGRLPEGASPIVTDVVSPEGNGMSSETLLFTARWAEDVRTATADGPMAFRADHEQRCVARIEPELDKVPVFPAYDLAMQYRVMSLVGERTSVPVPDTLWFEPGSEALGAPFFVMGRVDGEVPRDVLPYTFGDNWVADGTDADRRALQDSAVRALAGIHAIGPDDADLSFLQYDDQAGDTALERHLASWEAYHRWVVGDEPSPLLADCFAWLRANLPTDHGPDALSWGDARIGNMMFAGTDVVAVLDWEMAGVAPPEVDLGWMAYLHLFFQDLTVDLGLPGLPDMMRPADVAATYAEATGYRPADLTWFLAYAAMRHGVIMRRVTERAVMFGEAVKPPEVDDMIIHRQTLRDMLDGTYWERIAV
jgi:aminoglycoside phosphotransferase (APT) family kinase protein